MSSYKYDLLRDFCNCQEIIDLIDSQNPNVDKNDNSSLIYNNIFPFHQITFTEDMADAYLLFDVEKNNINQYNTSYHDIYVVIWSLSHRNRMRVENKNGTRIDLLSEAIERMFIQNERNECLKYGFDKFELIKDRGIILNNYFLYRESIFKTNDIKRPITI